MDRVFMLLRKRVFVYDDAETILRADEWGKLEFVQSVYAAEEELLPVARFFCYNVAAYAAFIMEKVDPDLKGYIEM
ncbi:hypothetical protein Pint_20787 [Pistacia integerrima]|uniref:Uncharacterized protein n=1 Tax=Pistacia integerrima TaxID=434235 RepID=A0ACC0XAA6_9ROSI|nr:hypothetical protein Pint_20787 [Pistacia integerrima]